jgi:hypothetical protein
MKKPGKTGLKGFPESSIRRHSSAGSVRAARLSRYACSSSSSHRRTVDSLTPTLPANMPTSSLKLGCCLSVASMSARLASLSAFGSRPRRLVSPPGCTDSLAVPHWSAWGLPATSTSPGASGNCFARSCSAQFRRFPAWRWASFCRLYGSVSCRQTRCNSRQVLRGSGAGSLSP